MLFIVRILYIQSAGITLHNICVTSTQHSVTPAAHSPPFIHARARRGQRPPRQQRRRQQLARVPLERPVRRPLRAGARITRQNPFNLIRHNKTASIFPIMREARATFIPRMQKKSISVEIRGEGRSEKREARSEKLEAGSWKLEVKMKTKYMDRTIGRRNTWTDTIIITCILNI